MSSKPKIDCFSRSALAAVWLAVLLLAGCHTINPYDPKMEPPMPAALQPPREMNKVSLPAYRIEPPDVVNIDMPKVIPLQPYHVENFDRLEIRAVTPPDQPLDSLVFMVEADGTINLGPPYGSVRVLGMTVDEVRAALNKWLTKWLSDPEVSVRLASITAGLSPSGPYMVSSDGTINLKQYGQVRISGMTVTEAQIAIQNHLKQFLEAPELSVVVATPQSKYYYVIAQGADTGDVVRRFPIYGNETVLDAISMDGLQGNGAGGLGPMSSKKIWIARPSPHNFGCQQILPVNWDDIVQGGQTATNYQLLPGDRLYVAADELITFTNVFTRVTSPIQSVAGLAGNGASTIRSWQTMGRHYNATRNGN